MSFAKIKVRRPLDRRCDDEDEHEQESSIEEVADSGISKSAHKNKGGLGSRAKYGNTVKWVSKNSTETTFSKVMVIFKDSREENLPNGHSLEMVKPIKIIFPRVPTCSTLNYSRDVEKTSYPKINYSKGANLPMPISLNKNSILSEVGEEDRNGLSVDWASLFKEGPTLNSGSSERLLNGEENVEEKPMTDRNRPCSLNTVWDNCETTSNESSPLKSSGEDSSLGGEDFSETAQEKAAAEKQRREEGMEGFRGLMERANSEVEAHRIRQNRERGERTRLKTVVIGGTAVLWDDLERVLRSMNIRIVPKKEPILSVDLGSSDMKKKFGTRELCNLQFNVNYNKSVKRNRKSVLQ
ncbi:hypothetical protein PanWU01x14_136320 [Parasponia andersonii]|uniref:Uncharacterized protein n=1 Tax=Parasponia andersonii TaxID=3476 RepID=A0A2P5CNU3_PARAD|nr:hypothetical protein PanWU01x14_136320 [Parasponia andersonii]